MKKKNFLLGVLGLAYVIDRLSKRDQPKEAESAVEPEYEPVHKIVSKFDGKEFKTWLKLRDKFGDYKRKHDWTRVVSVCNEIIQLDKENKFIGIMVPLFYKDMAYAYEKMEEINNALNYYQLAKDGFLKYRSEQKLSKPDDWLDTIAIIDKKIGKLQVEKDISQKE
jgi:hypothetical protein